MNVKDVKISDIQVIENVRLDAKKANIQWLMDSIKQHGLQQPIGLGLTKGGKYVLIFGQRRLLACTKLGWSTIPAVTDAEPELKNLLLKNITENLQREDHTPVELGRLCYRLKREFDMTEGEISTRLSVPVSKIKMAMDTYKHLPESVRNRVRFMGKGGSKRNGDIPATVAAAVLNARRSHAISQSVQKTLIKEIRHKELTSEDVRVVTALIDSGLSPKEAVKRRNKYKCYRLEVVGEIEDMDKLEVKYKQSSPSIIKWAAYGLLPPIKRPSFVKVPAELKVK